MTVARDQALSAPVDVSAAPTTRQGSRTAGALVRIVADSDGRWAKRLPPVPAAWAVTWSCTTPEIAAASPALADLGYRHVGTISSPARPPGTEIADIVAPLELIEDAPGWWSALTSEAWSVVTLLHGPPARLFADLLAEHRDAI